MLYEDNELRLDEQTLKRIHGITSKYIYGFEDTEEWGTTSKFNPDILFVVITRHEPIVNEISEFIHYLCENKSPEEQVDDLISLGFQAYEQVDFSLYPAINNKDHAQYVWYGYVLLPLILIVIECEKIFVLAGDQGTQKAILNAYNDYLSMLERILEAN